MLDFLFFAVDSTWVCGLKFLEKDGEGGLNQSQSTWVRGSTW